VAGAVIGGTIGAKAAVKFGELSETATRVRLMEIAYQRAIRSGLPDVEAAQEAALWSHDYTDYSRHGAKMDAWRRIVPFMNAGLQGNDIYARRLMASGDYGTNLSKVMLYPAYRLGLVKFDNLTDTERQDVAFSAYTWMTTIMGLGTIALVQALLYRDDERLKLLPEYLKTNHWLIPLEDVVHVVSKDAAEKVAKEDVVLRLPKPFQTVWFANLIERIVAEKMRDDPRWAERYMADLALMGLPPIVPTSLQMIGEMQSGKDSFTGRDIIPSYIAERNRAQQYTPYTSEFAKMVGPALNVSPMYVDYLVKKLGTSWGRTFLQMNVEGLPWYNPNKAETGLDQVFIARRFLWKHGRGSEAERVFRQDVMGGEDPIAGIWERLAIPYSKMSAKAKGYKNIKDKEGDLPRAIETLAAMSDAERGYAILQGHWEGRNAKYRKLHPMARVESINRVVSQVQREIVSDLFHTGDRGKVSFKQIILTPSEKHAARDILTQYGAMEMHNALVLAGEVGWEKRGFLPAGDVMEELKVAVPRAHAEIAKRLKKAKVLPFGGIKAVWPSLKGKLESRETLGRLKQGQKLHIVVPLIGEWSQAKFAPE